METYLGIVAVFVVALLLLLAVMLIPIQSHVDPAYKRYVAAVSSSLSKYGYSGDFYDSDLKSVVTLGYQNGVSSTDLVIALTMLFPNKFNTSRLRGKLWDEILDSTCGTHCDPSIRTVKEHT